MCANRRIPAYAVLPTPRPRRGALGRAWDCFMLVILPWIVLAAFMAMLFACLLFAVNGGCAR